MCSDWRGFKGGIVEKVLALNGLKNFAVEDGTRADRTDSLYSLSLRRRAGS